MVVRFYAFFCSSVCYIFYVNVGCQSNKNISIVSWCTVHILHIAVLTDDDGYSLNMS